MASIFPPSPQIGDVFESNNTVWQWNGEAWVVVPTDGLTFRNITTTPSTQTVIADSGADTLNLIAGENISITAASASDSITLSVIGQQGIINTASTAAYVSASAYTNSQINFLTTSDIEEGSRLYFTNQRAIDAIGGTLGNASAQILQDANDNIPTLFVHDNHTNITATYNSASNQIVLNTSGGLPAFGFDEPPIEGSEGQVYYQINSASTQILNYFQYINDEWIELGSEYNNWNYLLDGNWQYVLDEATGGWVAVLDGGGLASTASIDFNYRYIPHLVGEILFLTRQSASSTYLSLSTASTLYLNKNGGTVSGNLIVNGNFTVAGSVAYLNTEHVHIENNFITLNTGASGAYLNSGIEVYRGASPSVKIIFDENTDAWSFTNDGVNYNELGSGGGTVLYQVDQPDVSELEPGTLWVDSNQDAVSGLIPATFSRWVKTLSASTSTISGVDDNSEILLYNVDNEQVFINGTLLVRDNDYVGTSGSAIVLTEPALVGDVVEIHSYQQIALVDTYTTGEVDSLLDNIDALPSQTGNTGKYLTTNGSSASWGVLVIPETSSAAFTRWTKVYAASATLISGADDNAINLEYDLGLEQLFINGVMIARNEYTATSGSTIVLNDTLSVNDVVDIYSYQNTNNISTYSQAQIDAKYNNLVRWKKAYSASATVIQGLDDNSVQLSYTPNYEQLYLNGILLTPIADYARTSASVITLGQSVVTGDIVEVIGYAPFNVAEEVLPYSSSTPSSPIAGSVWVDSTNPASPLLKVYNGSTWVSVSGGDSGLHPFFQAGI